MVAIHGIHARPGAIVGDVAGAQPRPRCLLLALIQHRCPDRDVGTFGDCIETQPNLSGSPRRSY
jgi:hypothetical protein